MDYVRHTVALLITALSIGLAAAVPTAIPTATADPADPLSRPVDTAAQRLATADAVAAYKWAQGGPITDVARAQQVLDNVGADATAHGVDATYVRAIFENQIDATEAIEYIRFGQWKFDPTDAPTTAPDLSESRSAIDGFNKVMVNEIAVHWDSLRGPGCDQEVVHAVSAVVMDRGLDPMHQQALSSATRSYC